MLITPWWVRELRRLAFAAAAVLVFLFLVASALRSAEAAEDPVVFVRGLGERTVAVLTEPGLAWRDRQARLRDILKQGLDLQRIGRFILGKHWKLATAEQRDRFLRAYEDFLMAHYVQRLRDYAGERLEVRGIKALGGNGTVVRSRILRPDGPRVRVDWRLQRREERWAIVDVVVEGVSLALTHRAEFSAVLRLRGGIEGLVEALEESARRRPRADAGAPATGALAAG